MIAACLMAVTITGKWVEASTGTVPRHFDFNDFNDLNVTIGPCVRGVVGPRLCCPTNEAKDA